MDLRCDLFTRTDWYDQTRRAQAQAVHWLFEQRYLKNEIEARASRNAAFYNGKQWLEWLPYQRQMGVPPLQNSKDPLIQDRVTANVIGYLLEQKHASFARYEPLWSAPSFTRDEYDQSVSRFSSDLLGYYAMYGIRIPDINDRLQIHISTSPITFLEYWWDPNKGDALPAITLDDWYRPQKEIPPNALPDEISAIQQGNEEMRNEDVAQFRQLHGYNKHANRVFQRTGDPEVTIRTVFDTMWYPFLARTRKDVHAYLVSTVMSPEEVAYRYSMPMDEVLKHRNSQDVTERRLAMRGMYGNPHMQMAVQGPEHDNGLLVHQLHVDRVVAPPYGASVVVIGNSNEAIIVRNELGNALKELPLYPCVEYPSTENLWGRCTVDDLIHPQMLINDALTKANTLRRRRVTATLVMKKDTSTKALENGQRILEVDNIAEELPRFIEQPGDAIEEARVVEFNIRLMQDQAGVPDVSLGRTDDSDAKSGKAVQSLAAGARERLQGRGKMLDRAWGWCGTGTLANLQKYAVAERVTGIVGDDNSHQYEIWSSARLRPSMYDSENPGQVANVNVTTFSTIPQSPEQQQKTTLELIQAGVFPPDEIPRIVASVWGYQAWRDVADVGRAARDRAADNIERWKRGEMVHAPFAEQNHAQFIRIYEQWINTDEFTSLAMRTPAIGAEVRQHIQLHMRFDAYNEQRRALLSVAGRMMAAHDVAKQLEAEGMKGAAQMFALMSMGVGVGDVGGQPGGQPQGNPKEKPNEKGAEQKPPIGGMRGADATSRGDGQQPRPAGAAMAPLGA